MDGRCDEGSRSPKRPESEITFVNLFGTEPSFDRFAIQGQSIPQFFGKYGGLLFQYVIDIRILEKDEIIPPGSVVQWIKLMVEVNIYCYRQTDDMLVHLDGIDITINPLQKQNITAPYEADNLNKKHTRYRLVDLCKAVEKQLGEVELVTRGTGVQ